MIVVTRQAMIFVHAAAGTGPCMLWNA
eukprot:COSAG06_NODE_51457_length_312_cov_0.718310_1_plen_26_part_10